MATRFADNITSTLTAPPNVLIYGLDAPLADELGRALRTLALSVKAEHCHDIAQCLTHLRETGPKLVFCSFENGLRTLLHAVSGDSLDVPVIAVTRHPEVHQWLDAMEAGAADYCSAPFEPLHLEWILQSNIQTQFKTAE
ncbi:MAG: response regulator [Bryobacteraceae bacterium]|nr:response regulator [Bryobacteraceae bacterium]